MTWQLLWESGIIVAIRE